MKKIEKKTVDGITTSFDNSDVYYKYKIKDKLIRKSVIVGRGKKKKTLYTFEEVGMNECNWLASVDWKSNLERLEKIPRMMNSSSNQFDVNVRLSLVLNFD